jgi:hypothetical protein
MNCESCGESPHSPPMAQFWTEVHVGAVPSSEKFHLCPECSDDDAVDPLDFVEYHEVSA